MSTSCSRLQAFRFLLTLALTFSLAAGSWPRPQRAAEHVAVTPAKASTQTKAETEQRAKEAYGKLGVSFEENRGQADGRVRFISRGRGATVFLAHDEAAFVMSAPASASDERRLRDKGLPEAPAQRDQPKFHAVHMKFEGANLAAEVSGECELSGRVNYFRGKDPSKWQKNVKTYGAVRYRGLYDGVDLVYYGNEQGAMEYDFEVAPGADPRQISLLIEGAKALEVDAAGDLVISTPVGPLRQHKPSVYQEVGGARREVEGGYAVEPNGRVRFNLGEYDHSAPLVIDPVLQYLEYIPYEYNGAYDEAQGIVSDSSGHAYVTGYTEISDVTGGGTSTIIVAKLEASGSSVYFTYLEGAEGKGYDIAVDSAGNAYVTGYTAWDSFPVVNAYQDTLHGDYLHGDAFVFKLSANGSELIYSTYLGGSTTDSGSGIAVDSAGNAYVTGTTSSTDFPTKAPLQGALSGTSDAFVTKFTPDGSALVYSTYLGGSGVERVNGIAVDSAGHAYVAGTTDAADFPVVNAFQGANAGGYDAFVSKLNAAGSAFIYSTYLGGSCGDAASDIALDSGGRAYVTGATSSTDFPTANALQSANAGGGDAFVTRFKADGSGLVYSTYLGGSGYDYSVGIGVDSWGHATIGGQTYSTDFPLKDPLPSENVGNADAFVARLKANGSALLYSTYVGTDYEDLIYDVTADPSGNAYLAGTSPNPNPEYFSESPDDALVIKLNVTPFIKGRVVTQGATGTVGVPWATVKLTGTQTITKLADAHGYYSFTGLVQGGDYTVTVSKNNLSFVPPSRTYNNMFADAPDADFTVPSLSVGKVAVTEGNAGEASATFVVRLQPASTQPVTVNYQTADGTISPATAGTDYTALPLTTLTFDPGQTAKGVTVKVKGDTVDEADETFRLLLSAPTNALISGKEGVCVITDNDAAPSLSVNDAAVTEGDADVTATFTVTLSAASVQTVKVTYRTAFGTATAPADYTGVGLTTLTFAPGETTKTIVVQVRGDAAAEPVETFFVNLSNAVNATIADAQAVGTIADDD